MWTFGAKSKGNEYIGTSSWIISLESYGANESSEHPKRRTEREVDFFLRIGIKSILSNFAKQIRRAEISKVFAKVVWQRGRIDNSKWELKEIKLGFEQ